LRFLSGKLRGWQAAAVKGNRSLEKIYCRSCSLAAFVAGVVATTDIEGIR
jgi:hypothetical protein